MHIVIITPFHLRIDVADRQAVNCTDVDPVDCPYRAFLGECKTNPGYMLTKCGGSCNVDKCCTDKNSNCAYWASVGECVKNPGYMLPNCMGSCFPNRCLCTDKVPNCPALAASGECDKNPNYMLFYCKISCQQCEC